MEVNPVSESVAEVVKEKNAVSSDQPYLTDTFDRNKLEGVLLEIIEEFKEAHKNLEITVLRQPTLLEGEKITFLLNGEIQREIFDRIKRDLLGLLRKKLNNYSITLDFKVAEEDNNSKTKLYTNTDKLRYLKEKSPALAELQRRFGLETDF